MRLNLIQIGNSRGVRLSQSLIKQCGFKNSVEVQLLDHCLILKASKESRQDWAHIFEIECKRREESTLTDLENSDFLAIKNDWDQDEWEW